MLHLWYFTSVLETAISADTSDLLFCMSQMQTFGAVPSLAIIVLLGKIRGEERFENLPQQTPSRCETHRNTLLGKLLS